MPVSDSTAGPNSVKISGLIEHYTKTLQGRGYGPLATNAYKRAVEHFIAWSAPNSDCFEIGEAPIRRFIDEHLVDCSCAGRPQRGKVTTLSALRHLGNPARHLQHTAGTAELSGFHHLRTAGL